MHTPLGRRPVPRRNVLLAAIAVGAMFLALLAAAEVLRHPYEVGSGIDESQLEGSDPRDELVCPDPQPREGQERDASPRPDGAVRVSSGDLYDCPETYDGAEVVYRGEVVGALLERDEGVWTQLNDDVYAELLGPLPSHREFRGGNAGVGVLLPGEVASQIEVVGGPQTRGDILEITGTFHRVDPTGEVAVIRSDGGEQVSAGGAYDDPPLTDRRIAAWIAIATAACLVVAERVVRARR